MLNDLEKIIEDLCIKISTQPALQGQHVQEAIQAAYGLGKKDFQIEGARYPQRTKKELFEYAYDLGTAQSKEDKQVAELKFTQNWMHLKDKADILQLTKDEILQLHGQYIHGYANLPKA